jgi:hypothetical protein
MLEAQMYPRRYIEGDGEDYSLCRKQKEAKHTLDAGEMGSCGYEIVRGEAKRLCTRAPEKGIDESARWHKHINEWRQAGF